MTHRHSAPGNVDLEGRPELVVQRHPLAMVYGGGGVFGIAYTAGVAAGLAESGIPVADAPSLGTSAGSWTASALALGMTYDDFLDVRAPTVPNLRPGVLVEIARDLFGDATHHLVSVSAVCVRSRRRHILDGGVYPLADLVAASSAVPGLLPPHRIEGRLYVDGMGYDVRWSRSHATDVTEWTYADSGEPVVLPPGRMWWEIVPEGSAISEG